MLLKAIIIGKVQGTNKYTIEIPQFESTGDSTLYTTEATLCYQPGLSEGYEQGDTVFIDFEQMNRTTPVILGKLYLGTEDEPSVSAKLNRLNVNGNANISGSVTINNVDFMNMYILLKSMQQQIQELQKKVENN